MQSAFLDRWLANGQNATEAYRFAYQTKGSDAWVRREGTRLLKHPLIVPHVLKLQETRNRNISETVERIGVTKEWLVQELAGAFRKAIAAENTSGIGRIGELLARMHGMIIERKDVRRVTAWADLSDEELQILAQSAPLTGDGGKGKTTKH